MAQNFQQLNSRGLTTGIKLLVGAGAVAYGVSNSIYTGMSQLEIALFLALCVAWLVRDEGICTSSH
jgi:hypothetical protein